MKEFDIISIGGGSGGIATMNRAGEHGARAAVIEEKQLGGTCVNKGCVPKKIMWYGAQIAEAIRDYGPDYGFTSEQTNFDFATLRKNREAYIDRARSSYDGSFKRNGVEYIQGRARFVDAHTVEVNGETIKAKHIVIATGAHAYIPDLPGADLGETSDDVFAWEELPKSVAIIGAGYIAVELAGVLHALGVKIDLFVRGDRPLRRFDSYIVKGFPESYDMELLLDFLNQLKNAQSYQIPVYSHEIYDIVPDQKQTIQAADFIIVEGINVFQNPQNDRLYMTDFFDFSIYVDAEVANIESWYIDRFKKLLDRAKDDPSNYYHRFTKQPEEEVLAFAHQVWESINLLNLKDYIEPTRNRAELILHKSANHEIDEIYLKR